VLIGGLADAASPGNWHINAFVDNIPDEQFSTYAIDFSALGYSVLSCGRLRWYGIEFRYFLGQANSIHAAHRNVLSVYRALFSRALERGGSCPLFPGPQRAGLINSLYQPSVIGQTS
jgi:hypothetical protein